MKTILQGQRLLRIKDVIQKTGLARATIYYRVKENLFPEPVKLGRISLWPEHEIDIVINEIVSGASDERLKRVVNRLMMDRKVRSAA